MFVVTPIPDIFNGYYYKVISILVYALICVSDFIVKMRKNKSIYTYINFFNMLIWKYENI